MYAYRTLRPVSFPAGIVLALYLHQAAPRSHLLYEIEPGVYIAKEPVEFKAGETIGLMAEPAKGDSCLEPAGEWAFSATAENSQPNDDGKNDQNNPPEEDATEKPDPAMGQDPVGEPKPGKKAK